ncbi:CdaR family protein [Rhodohalobacter mucosus]|uniref:YbbR-like protein n=1 Tax=Rhodohalobacter mucosus TaxID=2079485 RepID=A0A316TS35_9BACT|nr:CdaR family protein [Rhodohalobacter mucosus]PWN05825.1 hypothetical protein DDZ15_11580 [Rhodohalobacter mucosus]
MNIFTFISERIKEFFKSGSSGTPEEGDDSNFFGRERVIVFSIAFLIAMGLWFMVNLSREFNITVEVPIQLVNLPENLALSSDIPEHASVNVTGEGWNLLPVYTNPPRISIAAEARQINLNEQVRNQMGAFSNLNILQVDPVVITIETEEKASKRVPVVSSVQLDFRSQFGLLQDPALEPDSVTVTAATSRLDEIDSWQTVQTGFDDINRSFEETIQLESAESNISVEPTEVTLRVDVSEYTEAEARIPVRTRNLPAGKAVTYNPSSVTVRFDVPIELYSDVQGTRPFSVYVDYEELERDTTGFITPQVEKISDEFNVRLRSIQPTRVSYFNIIPD